MAVFTILLNSLLITSFLLVFELNSSFCEKISPQLTIWSCYRNSCCFRSSYLQAAYTWHTHPVLLQGAVFIYFYFYVAVKSLCLFISCLKEQWRCSVPVVVTLPTSRGWWPSGPWHNEEHAPTEKNNCWIALLAGRKMLVVFLFLLALDLLLFLFFRRFLGFFIHQRFSAYGFNPWAREVVLPLSLRPQSEPFSYTVKYNILMAPWNLSVCACVFFYLCVSAYDFEWSNLSDERVAIVRGIIWLLLLR